jgi:hypothetical protein
MAAQLNRRSESAVHAGLKRLALIWAQARGYSACAFEVHLPHCRFRADVAAFREHRDGDRAAIFECKQSLSDLRRDNCNSAAALDRLQAVETRREIIERNLRVHYPTLGKGDSLFSDFETFDFSQLDHHGYSCVTRDAAGLRQRLISCTKFEKLAQYCCANLFYLVIGESLHETVFELPLGWGLLIEKNATLELAQKPVWHEMSAKNKVRFLRRLAAAATRALNRELKITPEIVEEARRDLGFSN